MEPHGRSATARFRLGRIVATPGVLTALEEAVQTPLEFLARHARGDWGGLDEHDRQKTSFRSLVAFACSPPTPSQTAPEYGSSLRPTAA